MTVGGVSFCLVHADLWPIVEVKLVDFLEDVFQDLALPLISILLLNLLKRVVPVAYSVNERGDVL
jgi:hypothetical protein